MLQVTRQIRIDERELEERFSCAPGPGGQNVNKVSTAVQLRFDVAHSASLPEEVRERLMRLAGNRISAEGILLIDAHRHRTRERNRQDARGRLLRLLQEAATPPKRRKPTRPTLASQRRRLEDKRAHAETKRLRAGILSRD